MVCQVLHSGTLEGTFSTDEYEPIHSFSPRLVPRRLQRNRMAPEYLLRRTPYTTSCDVYAFGTQLPMCGRCLSGFPITHLLIACLL
jgi:hypothetical protein